jgi:hypothetical protein
MTFPRITRNWRGLATTLSLYLVVLGCYGYTVHVINGKQLLSGEEATVSFTDVVQIGARWQFSHYNTNFAGHVFFWVFAQFSDGDIFYGRWAKIVAMALLAPLSYYVLRRRLNAQRIPSVIGALTVAFIPGVLNYSWTATENGLDTIWGIVGLLLVTSQRKYWWLAPIIGGIAISTYGSGIAWALTICLVAFIRWLRGNAKLIVAGELLLAAGIGAAVVLFPLWWWQSPHRVVVFGGGGEGKVAPLAQLRELFHELTVNAQSYYFFDHVPALGTVIVMVVAAIGFLLSMRLPAWWPWATVAVLTVVLYCASGGVLGIRRGIAISLMAGLAVGMACDYLMLVRSLKIPASALIANVLVVVLGIVNVGPLVNHWLAHDKDWSDGAQALPHDFRFPLPAGQTMVQTLSTVRAQLTDGSLTLVELAHQREAIRTLSILYVVAKQGDGNMAGIPNYATIIDLQARYPH